MILEFNSLKELFIFNVKYYRYLNNLSQEKLAELCNLSSRYIADIETGRHIPTISKIEKLANAFNIEPYILFKNIKRDKDIVNKIKISRQYNQNKISV